MIPIFHVGPTVKNAHRLDRDPEFVLAPDDEEGRAISDARLRGDTEALAKLFLVRYRRFQPGVDRLATSIEEVRANAFGVTSGVCLGDAVPDGTPFWLGNAPPEPLHLASLHVKGEPPWEGMVKIFLGSSDLEDGAEWEDVYIERPSRIHFFAETNPMAIACVAEHDVALLRNVLFIFRNTIPVPVGEFPFTDAERASIDEAMGW